MRPFRLVSFRSVRVLQVQLQDNWYSYAFPDAHAVVLISCRHVKRSKLSGGLYKRLSASSVVLSATTGFSCSIPARILAPLPLWILLLLLLSISSPDLTVNRILCVNMTLRTLLGEGKPKSCKLFLLVLIKCRDRIDYWYLMKNNFYSHLLFNQVARGRYPLHCPQSQTFYSCGGNSCRSNVQSERV